MSEPKHQPEAILEAFEKSGTVGGTWRALGNEGKPSGNFRRKCRRLLACMNPMSPSCPDGFHPVEVTTRHNSDGGVTGQTVKVRADQDEDLQPTVPDGFDVTGVSTYKSSTGETGQWVLARKRQDIQRDAMKAWAEGLAEEVRGAARPIVPPMVALDDLLTGYTLGDSHFGMLSWAEETGANYDLHIAEELTREAIDRLVSKTEPAKQALLIDLGDFTHVDNYGSVTPSGGNRLDADGRYAKIARVASRCMRYCVQRLLLKHELVKVMVVPGNHNPVGSVWTRLLLDAAYENEPRVTVDTSPSQYLVHQFGRNMIAATHNPNKAEDLALLMATRWPDIWGATEHRVMLTGHLHHRIKKPSLSVKGRPGCVIETFEGLPPGDAWHDESGYMSNRSMCAITWHREYGEESRDTVNVSRLVKP